MQQGARYNGYYRAKIYHPLVAPFASEGDYDGGRLGEGFVHAILYGRTAGIKGLREKLPKIVRAF